MLGIGCRIRINQSLAGKAVRTGSLREIAASAERVIDSARKFGFKLKEEILDFVEFTKRTLGNEIGAIGNIEKLFTAAKGPTRTIVVLPRQAQKKFLKHAGDFGISGNYCKELEAKFAEAIERHVQAKTTQIIEGLYRHGQKGYHYFDPKTNLWVFKDLEGHLVSGWKLSQQQVSDLLTKGTLW